MTVEVLNLPYKRHSSTRKFSDGSSKHYSICSSEAETIEQEFYRKYEPRKTLGRGGSSVVRLCIEKSTGVEYAVKIVFFGDPYLSEKERKQLLDATNQEIHMINSCSAHPNIVTLKDSFQTSSYLYLVLEMCRAELYDYFPNEITLSEKKTKIIMRQLFDALAYMHKLNIVHRDIKPENILIYNDDLEIRLTDLGFSTFVEDEQELTELCGTPAYLAPEILRVNMYQDIKGYGKSIDLWSSGVLMYALLVGTTPFWHRRQFNMFRKIMACDYTFDRIECSNVSDLAKDLIRKLLNVDPKTRITATEALQHSFFHTHIERRDLPKEFNARKLFKKSIICARFIVKLKIQFMTPEIISFKMLTSDPYKIKVLHKYIDAVSFKIYSHWVKKANAQNRNLLFATKPKTELKEMAKQQIENIYDFFPKY